MNILFVIVLVAIIVWLVVLSQTKSKKPLFSTSDHQVPVQQSFGKSAAVYAIQGQRAHMEDCFQGIVNLDQACMSTAARLTTPTTTTSSPPAFFAVYDGHGGPRASEYAEKHLHSLIYKHNIQSEPLSALMEGFKELDQNWLTLAHMNQWDDGSTAITTLIVNNTLYVANVGDSRAVLASHGKAVEMSSDHKPSRADERERIEKLGGRIIHYGTWRVEGILAVTRAFGDRRLKKYVSAQPEIKSRQLQPSDDYLILASDGVWDVLTSQRVVDIAYSSADCKEAAQKITETAYANHSMDNITTLVIDLKAFR